MRPKLLHTHSSEPFRSSSDEGSTDIYVGDTCEDSFEMAVELPNLPWGKVQQGKHGPIIVLYDGVRLGNFRATLDDDPEQSAGDGSAAPAEITPSAASSTTDAGQAAGLTGVRPRPATTAHSRGPTTCAAPGSSPASTRAAADSPEPADPSCSLARRTGIRTLRTACPADAIPALGLAPLGPLFELGDAWG
jgi:hypothetical protein